MVLLITTIRTYCENEEMNNEGPPAGERRAGRTLKIRASSTAESSQYYCTLYYLLTYKRYPWDSVAQQYQQYYYVEYRYYLCRRQTATAAPFLGGHAASTSNSKIKIIKRNILTIQAQKIITMITALRVSLTRFPSFSKAPRALSAVCTRSFAIETKSYASVSVRMRALSVVCLEKSHTLLVYVFFTVTHQTNYLFFPLFSCLLSEERTR